MANDKAIFKWIIPKFDNMFYGEGAESTPITMGKNVNIVFTVSLKREPDLQFNNSNNMEFYVNVKQLCKEKPAKLTLIFSILNASNEKVFTKIRNTLQAKANTSSQIGDVSKNILRELLEKNNLGTLVLFYEIKLELSENLETTESTQDYDKRLFKNEEFSDIILHIEDKKIPAHKAILASKSPVFKKMFVTDMEVSSTGQVKIVNFEYKIFIEVLRFIYTGKVEKLDQFVRQILEAANFYQLDDLVMICEKVLLQDMNYGNALDILKLANKCKSQRLKDNSVTFIQLHLKNFQNNPELKQLFKTHPNLLFEFMNQLSL